MEISVRLGKEKRMALGGIPNSQSGRCTQAPRRGKEKSLNLAPIQQLIATRQGRRKISAAKPSQPSPKNILT